MAAVESEATEQPRTFLAIYMHYERTIASLRAFALELDPAVQDSLRKGRSLISEAMTNLVKYFGFSTPEEFAANIKEPDDEAARDLREAVHARVSERLKQNPDEFLRVVADM